MGTRQQVAGDRTGTAEEAAEQILHEARMRGIALDLQQLTKLLVIVYGWTLALHGIRAFSDPIEAWRHGPMVARVYRRHARRRLAPMGDAGRDHAGAIEARRLQVIRETVDAYGGYTGLELATLTSCEGTPWHAARACRSEVVPDELLRSYYTRMAAGAEAG